MMENSSCAEWAVFQICCVGVRLVWGGRNYLGIDSSVRRKMKEN